MSLRPIKITFVLDGTGVYYDPYEPLMLDSLLTAAVVRWHTHGEPPARDEEPRDIPLPLARWYAGQEWGWRASALFPEGNTAETVVYWRKRFRQSRSHLTRGSVVATNGIYRDWVMPLPLMLASRMVAYAVGDAHRIRHELKRSVRYLGKKRSHGHGRVVDILVEHMEDDWSLVGPDGRTMRWLPMPGGTRLVRPRPPYWSIWARVPSCEIGVEYEEVGEGVFREKNFEKFFENC